MIAKKSVMSDALIAKTMDVPFGLQNHGSTCFLNATLQFIFTAIIRRPIKNQQNSFGKNLVQFCVDHDISTFLRCLADTFPRHNLTRSQGDVNMLVKDMLEELDKEDTDHFKIHSHGNCKTCPEYQFQQDLFVLPTCPESPDNTDLNDLIGQFQKTEDFCRICDAPVTITHKMPDFLLILLDQSFVPAQYKTIEVDTDSNTKKTYELAAFTKHYGDTYSGHETCAAKRGGRWYSFNDSSVSEFNALDVRQNHVRLLMYVEKSLEETEIVIRLPETSEPNQSKTNIGLSLCQKVKSIAANFFDSIKLWFKISGEQERPEL